MTGGGFVAFTVVAEAAETEAVLVGAEEDDLLAVLTELMWLMVGEVLVGVMTIDQLSSVPLRPRTSKTDKLQLPDALMPLSWLKYASGR